jgi:hypothetical protein
VLRLWPGCVVAAFDVPLGHLALDDARCCARTAGEVESPEEAVEEDEPAGTVTGVLVRVWFPPNRGGFLYAASRLGTAVFS